MGLFTLLLCCGVDAKDDSEDKYVKLPAMARSSSRIASQGKNNPSAQKSQKKPAKPALAQGQQNLNPAAKNDNKAAAAAAPRKSKKDALDDDNSVNETDTITNTNEDATGTPNSQTQPQMNATGGAMAPNTEVAPNVKSPADSPGEKVVDSDDPRSNDNESNYEPGELSEINISDAESDFDLTKIQEGQTYNPETGFLLGVKDRKFANKKCLILDLDETLVHSSFKYLRTADFVIPVEIDNQVHHVYVIKRPGVDEFLQKVGQWFEVVVFTASVSKYGDPLLNKLDIHKSVHHRLFRDSCFNYQGNFIKNLSQIGRPLSESIIIDNSPASYIFHPQHSVPISSWFSDTHDNELFDLLPFLEDLSKSNVDDVGLVLDISL